MRQLLLALLLLGTPVAAADRAVGIGSFERVRIDGAFDVRIVTGRSPRATLSGEPQALDRVELRVDGTTLTLRRRSDTATTARTAASPVVVTLAAQTLDAVTMVGAGSVQVTGMRTARADLSVAGSGTIAVDGVEAEEAQATVIGSGRIALAGHAAHVRLLTNGPGTIDAGKLVADDLTVHLDGPGETSAQARYLATVSSTGIGRVTVAGRPKCTVRAPAGGVVTCGP